MEMSNKSRGFGKGSIWSVGLQIFWITLEFVLSIWSSLYSSWNLHLNWDVEFLTGRVFFLVPFFLSRRTQAPATASLRDLCCCLESVASFGCLAYLMVWWWQKPSGRIKAETSASEKGAARQRGLPHYKLTMAAPASSFFFFLYL